MLGILSNLGLNSVEAHTAQDFDPNIHEAMLSVPSTEHPPNTISRRLFDQGTPFTIALCEPLG